MLEILNILEIYATNEKYIYFVVVRTKRSWNRQWKNDWNFKTLLHGNNTILSSTLMFLEIFQNLTERLLRVRKRFGIFFQPAYKFLNPSKNC